MGLYMQGVQKKPLVLVLSFRTWSWSLMSSSLPTLACTWLRMVSTLSVSSLLVPCIGENNFTSCQHLYQVISGWAPTRDSAHTW